MKRIIVLIIILTGFTFALSAAAGKSATTATTIEALNRIQAVFTAEPQTGLFKQTKTISNSSRKLISSGTVDIVPGCGVIWHTNKPYKSMLVVGKEYMIQKIRESEPKKLEVSSNQIYLSIAQCMDSLFSGDFNSLKQLFDLSYSFDDKGWSVTLGPSDKTVSSFFSTITMSGSSAIESLLINEKSGDSILYEFSELQIRNLSSEEMSVFNI